MSADEMVMMFEVRDGLNYAPQQPMVVRRGDIPRLQAERRAEFQRKYQENAEMKRVARIDHAAAFAKHSIVGIGGDSPYCLMCGHDLADHEEWSDCELLFQAGALNVS
jgi:hypothetical protein